MLSATTLVVLTAAIYTTRDVFAPNDPNVYANLYGQLNYFFDIFSIYHGDIFFSFVQFSGRAIGIDYISFSHTYFSILLAISSYSLFRLFGYRDLIVPLIAMLCLESYIFLFANVLRQGLAATLFLLALVLFVERRYSLFALFTVLAVLSHKSIGLIVLVFFIVLLALSGRISIFARYIIILVTFVLASFSSNLFANFFAGERVEHYVFREYDTGVVFLRLAILVFVLILGLWHVRLRQLGFSSKVVFASMSSCVIVAIGFVGSPLVFSRYLYYANFFIPMFLFLFICEDGAFGKKLVKLAVIVSALCYGYFIFSYESILAVLYYQ